MRQSRSARSREQVFSEFNIASDRETIIREYEENGFPDATFEWSSKPGAKPRTFDITFQINEGQQQFVREVVISGLKTTRPGLVDKQLELKHGQPTVAGGDGEHMQRKPL